MLGRTAHKQSETRGVEQMDGGGGGDHLGFLPNPSMYDILQSVGIFRTSLFIFCQLPLYSVLLFYCLQGISFFEVCLSFPLKSNATSDTSDVT